MVGKGVLGSQAVQETAECADVPRAGQGGSPCRLQTAGAEAGGVVAPSDVVGLSRGQSEAGLPERLNTCPSSLNPHLRHRQGKRPPGRRLSPPSLGGCALYAAPLQAPGPRRE